MADALDAVLQLRRERIARDRQVSEGISSGVETGLNAFIQGRKLQQQGATNQINTLLAQAKLKEALVNEKLTNKLSEFLDGGDGTGSVPPGTTAKIGPLNIPLNRKFTGEEQRTIGGAENIGGIIDTAIPLIEKVVTEKGGFSDKFVRSRVDTGNALLVSGESEKLTSAINQLKSIIPFAKGGKQLTPFEAKTLFRLLDMTGKEKSTIINDLKQFKKEFGRLSELAKGGSSSIKGGAESGSLPGGVTEEDIQFTMKKRGMTRDQVLEALNA